MSARFLPANLVDNDTIDIFATPIGQIISPPFSIFATNETPLIQDDFDNAVPLPTQFDIGHPFPHEDTDDDNETVYSEDANETRDLADFCDYVAEQHDLGYVADDEL